MSVDEPTRQQLLELVYEALPEAETERLRARIQEDPDVAAAYEEARSTAGLIAAAARISSARIPLRRPEKSPPPAPSGAPRAPRSRAVHSRYWSRLAYWSVGVAGSVILLLSLGGYLLHRQTLATIAEEHLRLMVAGPARLQWGVENHVNVSTTRVTGQPIPAQVELALYSPGGKQILRHKEKADAEGRLSVAIPALPRLPPSVRLEVLAVHRDKLQRIDAQLATQPPRYRTRIWTDRRNYRPGETVRYRSVSLARFSLAVDRELPLAFEVLGPGGAVLPGSHREGVTEHGVGNGAFTLPPDLEPGVYRIRCECLDATSPEAWTAFRVGGERKPPFRAEVAFERTAYRPGDTLVAHVEASDAEDKPLADQALRAMVVVDGRRIATETLRTDAQGRGRLEAHLPDRIDLGRGHLEFTLDETPADDLPPVRRPIPIDLARIDVRFFPEGGHLIAELENRVYFAASMPDGRPVEISGRIVDGSDNSIVGVQTLHGGMGSFTFTPHGGEHYALRIDEPTQIENRPKLPRVSVSQKVLLTTGVGVFEAGKPLAFNVRATESGLPLVASAWCRGVPVGRSPLVAAEGANSVVIDLEERVAGVIRLTVYDYSSNPPVPVSERLVYRRPARRVELEVDGPDAARPGDRVGLNIVATDEDGEPTGAILGVAVAQSGGISESAPPADLPAAFLLLGEVETADRLEELEDTSAMLEPTQGSATALDLLLGTQGWRRVEPAEPRAGLAQSDEPTRTDARGQAPEADLVASTEADVPPFVADNLGSIQAKYKKSLDSYRADRTRALNALIAVSLFGGVALAILVAMIVLLNLATSPLLWAPAFAVSVVCLLIGVGLVGPQGERFAGRTQVAFAPFELPSAAPTVDGEAVGEQGSGQDTNAWKFQAAAPAESRLDEGAGGAAKSSGVAQFGEGPARGNIPATTPPEADRTTVASPGAPPALQKPRAVQREGAALPNAAEAADMAPVEEQDAEGKLGESRQDKRQLGGRLLDDAGEPTMLAPSGDSQRGDGAMRRGRAGTALELKEALSRDEAAPEPAPKAAAAARSRTMPREKGVAKKGEAEEAEVEAATEVPDDLRRLADLARRVRKNEASRPDKQLKLAAEVDRTLQQYRFAVRRYSYRQPTKELSDHAAPTPATVFWDPLLLPDESGKVSLEFELPAQAAQYDIVVNAHTLDGRLGASRVRLNAPSPFRLEASPPGELTGGDHLELPVQLTNLTAEPLAARLVVRAEGEAIRLEQPATRSVEIPANATKRHYFELIADREYGRSKVTVRAEARGVATTKPQVVKVEPPGFPVSRQSAGMLRGEHAIEPILPQARLSGTLRVRIQAFPSPAAGIWAARRGLAARQIECFDHQAALACLDLLMLRQLRRQDLIDARWLDATHEHVARIAPIFSRYESPGHGWEMLGGEPADPVLTALGLFVSGELAEETAACPPPVRDMADRAARWLLGRRDGQGGFTAVVRPTVPASQSPGALVDAYLTWALSESGHEDMATELDRLVPLAKESKDPYFVALVAAAAVNAGRRAQGKGLMDALAEVQADDGCLDGAKYSPLGTTGRSLDVEATAMTLWAWQKIANYTDEVDRAVEWLVAQRLADGTFGSAHATMLVECCLAQCARATYPVMEQREIVLRRGAKSLVDVSVSPGEHRAVAIDDLEDVVQQDTKPLIIETRGPAMPFLFSAECRVPTAREKTGLRLTTKLKSQNVAEDEIALLSAELRNASKQPQTMVVAIIGLPAGLVPQEDSLELLVEAGAIDAYSLAGRRVFCYWRSIAADKLIKFNFRLHAITPGRYGAPPSCAFSCSRPDDVYWASPLTSRVTANY